MQRARELGCMGRDDTARGNGRQKESGSGRLAGGSWQTGISNGELRIANFADACDQDSGQLAAGSKREAGGRG